MRRDIQVLIEAVVGFAGVSTAVAVAAGWQRRAAAAAAAPRYDAARDAVLAVGRRERPDLDVSRPEWLTAAPLPWDALQSLIVTMLVVVVTFTLIGGLVVILWARARTGWAWTVAVGAALGVVGGVGPLSLIAPPLMTGDRHDPVGTWGDLLEPEMSVPLWWRVTMGAITLGILAVAIGRLRRSGRADLEPVAVARPGRRRTVPAQVAVAGLGAALLLTWSVTISDVFGAGRPYGWEFFF